MAKKKNLIIQSSGVFYTLVIFVFIVLPLFFKKTHIAVPKWMTPENRGIIIMVIVILYSILLLWLQDFFKKKWSERDYTPIFAIILAILVGISLI